MGPRQQQAFDVLCSRGTELSAADIAKAIGCSAAVVRLALHGLVKRRIVIKRETFGMVDGLGGRHNARLVVYQVKK